MECELLQSPMISYRSLLYSTTVLYDMRVQIQFLKQVLRFSTIEITFSRDKI